MGKCFREGERVKVSVGKLSGNEGVVRHYDSHGIVHLTLDRRVNVSVRGVEQAINKIGMSEDKLESLEPNDSQVESEIILEEPVMQVEPVRQVLTFQEGFRIEEDKKRAKYVGQAAEWKALGLCPHCGDKGRFSHCAFVCSRHGVY